MRQSRSANKSPHVVKRGRDYLRPDEANALIETAGKVGRQPLRDQCLLRLIYRHGLRASKARDARWTDFDITAGSGPKTFHMRRLKGSVDSVGRHSWPPTRLTEGAQLMTMCLRGLAPTAS